MSLLTIVQNAADEVKILKPSQVIGNNDEDVKLMLRLSNKVGKRLMKIFAWEILSKEHTFTSVALEDQATATPIPNDFDRFIGETIWNRTDIFMISGPVSSKEWQGLKAVQYSDTEQRKLRHRGGSILIIPTIDAGKTIAYEYVSKNWCEDSSGTDQAEWAADTDVGILDEELLTLGLIWEYLNTKSLPNAAQAMQYKEYFDTLVDNDKPGDEILVAGDIFGGGMGRHFDGQPPVSGSGGLF